MVTKLPGRTPASAGTNSPPELASKIVTLRMSPMPKRRSFGRLRSGNSPTSRGTAFAKTLATLGVIRTKAYGTLFGSCCPAHTSQLAGPLAGINAQPPAPASELKSIKPNTMPRQRTVALPPTDTTPSAKDHARSMRRLVDDPSHMWSFSRLCYHSATPRDAAVELNAGWG